MNSRGLQGWVGVMRLFLAAVLLMTMALFSAARGEERIALLAASPTCGGAPAITDAGASAEGIATSLRQMGFTVRLPSDGECRTGLQSIRPSLLELMPTETNSALQGLGVCAPKLSS